jgi:tetratricopeptide (TPR) repeat protein
VPDTHLWISGAGRTVSAEAAAAHHPDIVVDCHRRLRGPYTGTGSLIRALVPAVHARRTDLLSRHAIEILAVAPELDRFTGPAPETLTSLAPPEERVRWYSRLRTRRIAHGLVDFLREASAEHPLTVAFGTLDEADPTDLEFLSIALRRLNVAQVQLIVCSRSAVVAGLDDALAAHCRHQVIADRADDGDRTVAAYVASDGTSDIPAHRAAYLAADPELRARLHDERAAGLAALDEWSLRLGAIPFHLEHGSAPGTAGRKALREAIGYCMGMGFYDAALNYARRFAPLIDAEAEPDSHYGLHATICVCLGQLERPDECEPIYYDMLSRSAEPARHMKIAYSLAILHTRLYGPGHKDHRKALAHVNTAIAIAGLLEDPAERAFQSAFMQNGKALVEMHLGNLTESLRLVSDSIGLLDRELPPGEQRLHRSVLAYNHGQVLAALGRPDEALADFNQVIDVDPNYPEYRFDRGNLLAKLGRYAEAIADYEDAMRLSPPFPELYYNRGDARAALGDLDGALRDFGYVLDLEPGYLEATVSIATLLIEAGDPDRAAEHVRAGLTLAPGHARLHCTLGLALLELADHEAAHQAFDDALRLDPGLSQARVNRAVASCGLKDYEAALADLSVALEADPRNPDLLYNRGFVYRADGRLSDAIADYTQALLDQRADQPALFLQRAQCYLALGLPAEAGHDLDAHLALAGPQHEDETCDCRAAARPA